MSRIVARIAKHNSHKEEGTKIEGDFTNPWERRWRRETGASGFRTTSASEHTPIDAAACIETRVSDHFI